MKKIYNYNIIYFILGRGISLLGTQVYNFVLSLVVLRETGSALSFAFSLIISTIPRILFSTLGGTLADKYNRKCLIITSDIISALILIMLIGCNTLKPQSLVPIYVCTFFLNIANTVFDITMYSSMNNIFDTNQIQKASSVNEAMSSLASILAPILGGALYSIVSFRVILLLDLISFIVSIMAENLLEFNYEKVDTEKELKKQLWDLKNFLIEYPAIFILYASAIIINVSFTFGIMISYPYIVIESLRFDAVSYGVLDAVIALRMFISSLFFIRVKIPEKKYKILILALGIEGFSIGGIGFPIFFELSRRMVFIFYCLDLFVCGFSTTAVNLIVRLYMQATIPEKHKGKIFGTLSTVCLSVNPIAMIIAGILLEGGNPYRIPIIAGILFMVMTIMLFMNKHIKEI